MPPTSLPELLKFLTEDLLSHQAPDPPGMATSLQGGLYKPFFDWLKTNRVYINNTLLRGTELLIVEGRGPSNWPTMTGQDEYTISSFWYNGGRGLK